jgi:glycosyltransferase involved in cell wall biosynthesis
LGLALPGALDVRMLPRSRTWASVRLRFALVRAAARGELLWFRSWKHADAWVRRFGGRAPFVFEAHEVPSAWSAGRERDADIDRQRRVLGAACALVANAPGTLDHLRATAERLPAALVAHNATCADRVRREPPGFGVGYVGSVRAEKDIEALADAADRLDVPITVVGAEPDQVARIGRIASSRLRLEPPIPWSEVPDRLARFALLVLPLAPGPFGEALTSPLKLWDYLASGVPVVGADTPALRAAAGGWYTPYRPGDGADLARAIASALDRPELRARAARAPVRTWDDRAAEIDAFLNSVPS